MSRKPAILFFIVLTLSALLPTAHSPLSTALGQSATATLSGTVQDEQGGLVAGADVSVIDADKGIKRQTHTNDEGSFTVPLLRPGTYVVRVESPGFATVEIKDVSLMLVIRSRFRFNSRLPRSPRPLTW